MTIARVDVIVTNWNQHEYVEAAVASALDQDDVHTRVILVDDASDVPLPEVEWPDRVTVLRRQSPGGQGATINTGLRAATAEVVTFLDGDDLFPSYRCASLLDAIAHADAAYGGQVVFADGTTPITRLAPDQLARIPAVDPAVLVGTTMLRRELFDRFGYLPEGRMIATFIEWMAVARAQPEPPIEAAVARPVLLRRTHANNASRRLHQHTGDYLTAIARRRAQQS